MGEKKGVPISVGNKNQHITCTSTPLEGMDGSRPEAIDKSLLDRLYEELYGMPVSSDLIVQNIQHEQVIVRQKRMTKEK